MGTSHDGGAPIAVITGGSQGLGYALAEALAGRGWELVVDARRVERLDEAVGRLSARTRVIGVAGDVTDPEHRTALACATDQLGGEARAVVNNASTLGRSPLPSLQEIDPDTFRRVLDVNVVAPIALVQALGDRLTAGAAVVNVTSDAGVEAYEGWGGYGASKAALEQASRVLAVERPELRVLVVDPGDMRTEMHRDAFPGEDISDRPEPDVAVPGILALLEGTQPSGRYAAHDVSGASSGPTVR